MSLENAIDRHTDALNNLAGAIRSLGMGNLQMATVAVGDAKTITRADEISKDLNDMNAGRAKALATAKEEVKPDAELEQAVSQVEEAEKTRFKERMEEVRENTKIQAERAAELGIELDYKTDVRPVLLDVAKKKGQPALKDLLAKYGAATGDKLGAEHFPAIVADAKKLVG